MIKYKRILLTGASGALGRVLRQSLPTVTATLRLTDRESIEPDSEHEEVTVCDLADRDAVMDLTRDVDAIVHMGGMALENTFDTIVQSNIIGLYNIFEGARRNGVKRVIWASSVHAIGYYKRTETIEPDCLTRPDSLYGVSKVYGEAIAQYYYDKFSLESVSIRIGSCVPKPLDWRMLTTWLSYPDLQHLIERCLTVPKVDHTILYGVSKNDETFWDNTKASHIGYRPKDNAEIYRAEIEANVARPDPGDPIIAYQGGPFVAAGHFEDP